MVKFSNNEWFFWTNFHWWLTVEMVKKFNSKMNCMVRFNCCMGHQIGFSLLDFCPSRQWYPSRWVWGSSHVLSLLSDGLPPILSFHLSVFSDGEVVQWWDDSWWCSDDGKTLLSWRFNLRVGIHFIVGVDFVVGANFVFPGQYPVGHVRGGCPGGFRAQGHLLTTLDTLLVCNLSW